MDNSVRRGDIFYADLSPVVGSEQGGVRPVLIIQNDMGNRHSPTVIAAAITSQMNKAKLPTHIELVGQDCGLTILTSAANACMKHRSGSFPTAGTAAARAVWLRLPCCGNFGWSDGLFL